MSANKQQSEMTMLYSDLKLINSMKVKMLSSITNLRLYPLA